jgi:hypothetical protein
MEAHLQALRERLGTEDGEPEALSKLSETEEGEGVTP